MGPGAVVIGDHADAWVPPLARDRVPPPDVGAAARRGSPPGSDRVPVAGPAGGRRGFHQRARTCALVDCDAKRLMTMVRGTPIVGRPAAADSRPLRRTLFWDYDLTPSPDDSRPGEYVTGAHEYTGLTEYDFDTDKWHRTERADLPLAVGRGPGAPAPAPGY